MRKMNEKQLELESTAILVIACNRPAYLQRTLRSLVRHKGERSYPIIVSQDGTDAQVAAAIRRQGGLRHLQHVPESFWRGRTPRGWDSYHCIARHYRWALSQVFDRLGFERVIVLEDDLEIAVDFFDYIEAAAQLMVCDPTIWTVSAWNDNGHTRFAREKDALFRSDFFPGLGWLLTRGLWHELSPKWPARCWDDWLREPAQRRGRVSIRPEVSRTHTFGEVGVSRGQFYAEHLRDNKLNTERVGFGSLDLGYLRKENYDPRFLARIGRAPVVSLEAALGSETTVDQCVEYQDEPTFSATAATFGLMTDVRGGVARTGYQGVVEFWYKSRRIFLLPVDFPRDREDPPVQVTLKSPAPIVPAAAGSVHYASSGARLLRTVRVDFCDFWPTFRKDRNWFIDLLSRRFRIEVHEKPDFLIYSNFGPVHRHSTCPRIFFTGEVNRPDFRVCDYALTCHYLTDPRHYRLPLYPVYLDAGPLLKAPDEAERTLAEKTKFCAFVVSNPSARKRVDFFRKLSRYKPVDSGGRYLNNLGRLLPDTPGHKREFLRPYKFNIAFENQSLPGYTTEKLPHAMEARCIPIYWGSPRVHEEFNPRSFLNCSDFPSEEALIERIRELDQDDAQYLALMREPYFHHNKINEAYDLEKLLDFFEQIFFARVHPVGARRSFFSLGHRALDKLETWILAR